MNATTGFEILMSEILNKTNSTIDIRDNLSPRGFAISACILFFIMIIGSFNNMIVIVVVGGTKKLRTSMNKILLNLSVCDFITSICGTPMSLASAVNHQWIFGEHLCQAYAFLMTLTGMTAIGTLVAVAIDRYIIISRSFQGQTMTGTSSTVTISGIWVYSLIQSVPPLFGWNRFVVEHPGIACSLDWQTADFKNSSFIIYIFILGYFLPIIIMSFCYFKVVWIIRTSPRTVGKSSTAKAETKVTVMACAMIICTMLAWTPYAVVSLMVSLGYGYVLGPVASVSPALFAKTSVIYNPIVYFFFNTQIREAILDKIPQKFRQRPRDSAEDISLETKRGLTAINTMISNQVLAASGNKDTTTPNL